MNDHQHRQSHRGIQMLQQVQYLHLVRDVQMRCRLVKQQQIRLLHQCPGNRCALLLSPAQFRHQFFPVMGDAGQLHIPPGNVKIIPGLKKLELFIVRQASHQDIIFHGDPVGICCLRDNGNLPGFFTERQRFHRFPFQSDRSLKGREYTGDAAKKRRFP